MPRASQSTQEQYRRAVATYVKAGGEESVQRVITAVQSLNRKLDQWYARQLADLDIAAGEWGVVTTLAKAGEPLTLDQLADRGLIERTPDATNRTRVFVSLTDEGWQLFSLAIRGSDVVESDVLQDLSDAERGELARMLEVVIARLDDVDA